MDKICEHIDHICQIAGNAKHVGIGTDLDGGYGTEQTPMDLDSIADLVTLAEPLARPRLQRRRYRWHLLRQLPAVSARASEVIAGNAAHHSRPLCGPRIATANAFILYLDRICMGAVVQSASFQQELGLSKDCVGDVLASFFLAYALGQLPAGLARRPLRPSKDAGRLHSALVDVYRADRICRRHDRLDRASARLWLVGSGRVPC